MLEHLFGSKTRLKLLRTFFRDPEKKYFVRELTRLLEVQINAVRRELEMLTEAGIIRPIESTAPETGEQAEPHLRKYYKLNSESILYPELHALLIKEKVLGEQEFIEEIRTKSGDIKLLLLTGRFTQDKRAPSDMLIVGGVKEKVVENIVSDYEKELGFEMRYTIMTEKEFSDRKYIMDKFLYTMFEAKHLEIVNVYGK